ncbi:NAD(+) diphosphatase [Acuticoccus sp.]|uniref:NAD(+) diphosphatase n=1 Tax=Acuticoccus sp. TaxID=1904378 RepID=UPI003B5272AF
MTLHYPPTEASAATGFGGNAIDRMSERRDDAAFIANLRADPSGRALLFMDDRLIMADAPLFDRGDAEARGADWEGATFLGLTADGPLFAAAVPPDEMMPARGLRGLAMDDALSHELLGIAAQARSLLGWHATHRFCANCGQPTTLGQAGYRRECGACGTHHFPRTDPVVIMLAVDGERCLLGRQRRFAPGVYSCLAGFMEPGETIETAVRREIWEESGIRTGRVAYHASQPWPFPSNLMIGCFTEALSQEIEPRDRELEDVRWFDRSDIGPMLDGTHPVNGAPPPVAIAHHLLTAYARHGAPVVEVPAVVAEPVTG